MLFRRTRFPASSYFPAAVLSTRTHGLRGFHTMGAGHMPKNISLTPQLHGGPLSGVARLLDRYEQMLTGHSGSSLQMYSPYFHIRETDDAYYLDGELPGVLLKDLEIEFEDSHRLNIEGHSENESTSEKGSWLVSERSIGGFQRTFNFPSAVDEENTRARLRNGVLSMTVPKKGETGVAKKIAIEE